MCQCDNVTIGCAMIRKAMGRTMIRKVISTLAHWYIGTLFIIGILFTGCSTKKNTAGSRFYHAMTTGITCTLTEMKHTNRDAKPLNRATRTTIWR